MLFQMGVHLVDAWRGQPPPTVAVTGLASSVRIARIVVRRVFRDEE